MSSLPVNLFVIFCNAIVLLIGKDAIVLLHRPESKQGQRIVRWRDEHRAKTIRTLIDTAITA